MNPSARMANIAVAVAGTIALGGCASSLSGVGGTQSYACKAPIGAPLQVDAQQSSIRW